MRKPAFAILAAAAALLASCGGGAKPHPPPPSLAEGARVFASSCSGCHTLAPTRGHVPAGGPLAGYRFTTAQLDSFVKTMPVPRPLTGRERQAVVAFVAHVQRTGATRK
ncbi:MAG: c-type cytochrome [Thermoleophilaceae bacterium]